MRLTFFLFILASLLSCSPTINQAVTETTVPDKMTKQTVGLFKHLEGAYEGYTLFQPRHYSNTYLIDMEGNMVHEWKNNQRVENAKLLESGLLLRMVNIRHPKWISTPGPHGKVQLVNWMGEVQWEYIYADDKKVLHHDVVPLPNGNFLMSTFELKTKEEAIAAGREESTIPEVLLIEKIIEVKPEGRIGGEIVWEWSVWDHMVQDHDETKSNYGKVSEHPELFNLNYFRRAVKDWNHVSGLDYNPDRKEILITFHGNDEIIIIDHSTTTAEAASHSGGTQNKGGDILYRWGNPQAYDQGTEDDKHFWVIHNAHYIPNGLHDEGKIMVLNNQYGGSNSFVEILDIQTNTDGSYSIPTREEQGGNVGVKIVYDDFHTRNMGGMQRLPNGNTLIDVAVKGQFIEVTPDNKIVWEYVNPIIHDGALAQGDVIPPNFSGDLLNEVFRVHRLPKDHPAFLGKDLSTKNKLELPPGARTDNPPVTPKAPPGVRMNSSMAGNQTMDLSSLNLSKEQEASVQAILQRYGSERRKASQSSGGNMGQMISQMRAIGQKQNKEVQPLLTDEQYDLYMDLVAKQRRSRRN